MRIEEITAEHMIYLEPERFIQKHVLPFKVRCYKCRTTLTIDMLSDLRAHDASLGWLLATDCPMCQQELILRADSLSNRPIDKYFGEVVKYYVSRYPASYVFFHDDDDGSHIGIPAAFLLIGGFFAGLMSLFTRTDYGDANNIALTIFWVCLVGLLYIAWACQSPRKKERARNAIGSKIGLTKQPPTSILDAHATLLEDKELRG